MEKFIFFVRQWIIPPMEILILTVVIFYVYKIMVRTRAIQILKGVIIIAIVFAVAYILKMEIILWLLQSGIQLFAFALVVIFSQEIRRIFLNLGTKNIFSLLMVDKNPAIVEIITDTVAELSEISRGALIIFEKKISLNNYIENTGVRIDGAISKELLLSIFFHNAPLHDGAVICKDDRIIAASVVVNTSMKPELEKLFGTRHRAGIGVTEESDAVAIIVSEETGKISLVSEGKITYNLEISKFKKMLSELLYGDDKQEEKNFLKDGLRKINNWVIKRKKLTRKWLFSLKNKKRDTLTELKEKQD